MPYGRCVIYTFPGDAEEIVGKARTGILPVFKPGTARSNSNTTTTPITPSALTRTSHPPADTQLAGRSTPAATAATSCRRLHLPRGVLPPLPATWPPKPGCLQLTYAGM